MGFLLDTMTFIKAYGEGIDAMPKKVQRLLTDQEEDLLISTISLSEIAIKNSVGKLNFPIDRVNTALADMRLAVISYTSVHAQALFRLPFFEDHRDPFDRMLIATALKENIPLIGSDKHFKRYEGLQAIWT